VSNSASSGDGLYVATGSATATLTAVTVSHNDGEGLATIGGTVRLLTSTLENNGVGIYARGTAAGSLVAHNSLISGNQTAGLVYDVLADGFPITLGGAADKANTFRNNGLGGGLNIDVRAGDIRPPVSALYNDWGDGVVGLADIEARLHHQFDDDGLARVEYYALSLVPTPTQQWADGVSAVALTATLGGLLSPQVGETVVFTTDLGNLSAPTDTIDASSQAGVLLTSAAVGAAQVAATMQVDQYQTYPAVATVDFVAPPDVGPPSVTVVSPGDGATDVAIGAAVVVTFSEAIDAATFSHTVAPDTGGWSPVWSGDGAVVALAHNLFAYETAYTVTVSAADDLAGNPLANAPYTWGFTTAAARPPIASFTISAQPAELFANGVDTSMLVVTATDASGSGAPFAGEVVTLTWTRGFFPSPVTVTLGAGGVATHTYTAGTRAGVEVITAMVADVGGPKVATTTIRLHTNPLGGRLTSRFSSQLITYTFVVSNADQFGPQVNVVLTGSVPAHTALITVAGGSAVTAGGDYGWGYVSSPVVAELQPSECYTLTWTILPLRRVGDIVNQAHAASDTAVLRLALLNRVCRVLLPFVFRDATW
jgi:hypothetical protein